MEENRLAVYIGLAIVILQVLAGFVVHFRRRLLLLPQPVIILVCGQHMSPANHIAREIQNRLRNSLRPFLHASSDEFLNRLAPSLCPDWVSSDATVGDPMFDAWYFVKQSDGSYDLNLAERGARAVSGIHRSWHQLLEAGNNLIIDYTVMEESLFTDLFVVFKKYFHRIVVIDIQVPLSPLLELEAMGGHQRYPKGYVKSSHRLHKSLKFPEKIVPMVCPQDTVLRADTVYKHISQTGLI